VFNSNSQALVQKLEEHIGQPFVDVTPYITMCTLDIICGKTFIIYLLRSHSYFVIKEAPQQNLYSTGKHTQVYLTYVKIVHMCVHTYKVRLG